MPSTQFSPLQPIGENIHFFQPPEPAVTSSPALITLCTWLGGATTQRIQKYVAGYRALYPNSAILLITTRILEISALPFSVLHARLAPARDVIRRVGSSGTGKEDTGSILLHIFSHGGCNTVIQLALSLRWDPMHPGLEIRKYLCGIIFDCCPGDTSFGRAYQAAAHSLPRSVPARTVGKVLLYPVIGVINGLQQTGWMSSVRDLRAQLNDPASLGRQLHGCTCIQRQIKWLHGRMWSVTRKRLGLSWDVQLKGLLFQIARTALWREITLVNTGMKSKGSGQKGRSGNLLDWQTRHHATGPGVDSDHGRSRHQG